MMTQRTATPEFLNASAGPGEQVLMLEDVEANSIMASLQRAIQPDYIERDINSLEAEYPGTVNLLSPKREEKGVSRAEQIFKDIQTQERIFASRLIRFIKEPFANGRAAIDFQNALDAAFQPASLKAGLIGDHIEYMPVDYEPFYALVMRRGRTKAYKNVVNGSDTLQYEAPLTWGTAYNYSPGSVGGALSQAVSGTTTTIYPYFLASLRYTLSIWEWATRLLNCIAQMKARVMRDIDVQLDADVLTMFDAVIPNGTLYSSHQTHSVTITDTEGAVDYDKFMEGSNLATRHRYDTGTKHRIAPGFALCDPEAVDDMQKWGTDQYTEVETSQIVQNGFGKRYNGAGLVLGRQVERWNLLEMPLEQATDSRRVRYFGDNRRIGYLGSITVNNKAVYTKVGPQSGQDINVNEVQRVTEPPGYSFYVQAWSGHYLQIINHFGLAKLNH